VGHALVIIAVFLGAVVVSATVALAVTVHRLRRPMMLSPAVRVPLRWRWSLARQAVLHRRLLVAIGGVRLELPRAGGAGPWSDLIAEVEALALEVDRELVAVESHPRPIRQKAMAGLEARVREVEQVAGRLGQTLGSLEAGRPGRSAAELMERLDAIQGALAELDAVPGASRSSGGPSARR